MLQMMSSRNYIQRHPAASYFILTFLISWLGASLVVAPKLFNGEPIPKMDGILMFPIMLVGPVAASIILTALCGGKAALRALLERILRWRVPIKWYFISLAIPPCLILTTLLVLKYFVSPAFTPNFFPIGLLFGIPAGLLEEIGWTGFALPKLRLRQNIMRAGILIGLFWGMWHLPVIDFLGAASPHGQYLLPFLVSFIAILVAIRLLIVWIDSKTNSIPAAQFTHAVSTGCLVMLGPSTVTPAQEATWYALYAILLWVTVLLIYKST